MPSLAARFPKPNPHPAPHRSLPRNNSDRLSSAAHPYPQRAPLSSRRHPTESMNRRLGSNFGSLRTPSCTSREKVVALFFSGVEIARGTAPAHHVPRIGDAAQLHRFLHFRVVFPYSLTNEIAESVSDEGSADPSRCSAYGGVLLACQGKFPVHQLQKASQFPILLLKILDPEPQSRHYVLPRRALSIP
jgi:hypothetical protein